MNKDYSSKLNIHRLDAGLQKLASSFSCGNSIIDNFLRSPQALDNGVGTTYVLLDENNSEVIGYYNFTAGSVDIIDGDVRKKAGGAIHLNEFALDERYQGAEIDENKKLSDFLLSDFISRVEYIRNNVVGLTFVTLRSTERGESLYNRNDFDELEEEMDFSPTEGKDSDGGKAMYLPLGLDEFN